MIDKFSDKEFLMANYWLALQNNVLLEVMISNQVAIMRHLGLPVEINKVLFDRVIPNNPNPSPDKEFYALLKNVERLAPLTQIRVWNFVKQLQSMKQEFDELEKTF